MARMCVGTKRMDVAAVCMGRMNNAVAARALREADGESDDAKAAILALHLGMIPEAEEILKVSRQRSARRRSGVSLTLPLALTSPL